MTSPEVQRLPEPLKLPTTKEELQRLNQQNIGTRFRNTQRYKANFEEKPYDWKNEGRNIAVARVQQLDGSFAWGYIDGHHRAHAAEAAVKADHSQEQFIKDIFLDVTEKRLDSIDPEWRDKRREPYLTKKEYIVILAEENNKQIEVSSKRTAAYLALDGWEALVGEEQAEKVNALVALHYLQGYEKIARSEWNAVGKKTSFENYATKFDTFYPENSPDDVKKLRNGLAEMRKLIHSANATVDDVAKDTRSLVAPYGQDELGTEVRQKLLKGLVQLPGIQQKLMKLDAQSQNETVGNLARTLSCKVTAFTRERTKGMDMDPIKEIIKASEDPLISLDALRTIVDSDKPSNTYKTVRDTEKKAIVVATYTKRYGNKPSTTSETWLERYHGQLEPTKLAEEIHDVEDILRDARGLDINTKSLITTKHPKIEEFLGAANAIKAEIEEKKIARTAISTTSDSVTPSDADTTTKPAIEHAETKQFLPLAEELTARLISLGETTVSPEEDTALRNLSEVLTAYFAQKKTMPSSPPAKIRDTAIFNAESDALPSSPHVDTYRKKYGEPSPYAASLLTQFADMQSQLPVSRLVAHFDKELTAAQARGVDTTPFIKGVVTLNALAKRLSALREAQPSLSEENTSGGEKPTGQQSSPTKNDATAVEIFASKQNPEASTDTIFEVPLHPWEHILVGEKIGTREWFAGKKNKSLSEQDKRLITEMVQAAARVVMNTKVPNIPHLNGKQWHDIINSVQSREAAGLDVTVATAAERFAHAAQELEVGKNDPLFRVMSAEYMLLALKTTKEQALTAEDRDRVTTIQEYENMFEEKIPAYIANKPLKAHTAELTQILLLSDENITKTQSYLKLYTPTDIVLTYIQQFKDTDETKTNPPFYFLDLYCSVTGVTKTDKITVIPQTEPNISQASNAESQKPEKPLDMNRHDKAWFTTQKYDDTKFLAVIQRAASRVLGTQVAETIHDTLECQKQGAIRYGDQAIIEKLSPNILTLTQGLEWSEDEKFDYLCASFYVALLRQQASVKQRQGLPYLQVDDAIDSTLEEALTKCTDMDQRVLQFLATIPTHPNTFTRRALVTEAVNKYK